MYAYTLSVSKCYLQDSMFVQYIHILTHMHAYTPTQCQNAILKIVCLHYTYICTLACMHTITWSKCYLHDSIVAVLVISP